MRSAARWISRKAPGHYYLGDEHEGAHLPSTDKARMEWVGLGGWAWVGGPGWVGALLFFSWPGVGCQKQEEAGWMYDQVSRP